MKARKQSSTSYPILFLMVDSSDHITGKTGLTPTVTISKNGAAFGSPSGAVTELSSGWYALAGNATDRNTVGEFLIHATGTGADPLDDRYLIVPFDPFDAAGLGLTNLDAAVSVGPLDLSAGVETGLTVRQALRLISAALAGKLSGAATTTITIRNAVADSKNRITASVDANGNRSAITVDLT